MNTEDKKICKAIIRMVKRDYDNYNKYNVAGHAEKRLIWDVVETMIDNMPLPVHRIHNMREYIDRILCSRFLLNI